MTCTNDIYWLMKTCYSSEVWRITKGWSGVITTLVEGFLCTLHDRIYELYGREASRKKTLSPSRHQGSSNQKF
nr:hypothetical protein CFP56_02036 [Quercus suber]